MRWKTYHLPPSRHLRSPSLTVELFRFVRHLKYFYLDRKHEQPRYRNQLQHKRHMKRTLVLRRRINAFKEGEFVAI